MSIFTHTRNYLCSECGKPGIIFEVIQNGNKVEIHAVCVSSDCEEHIGKVYETHHTDLTAKDIDKIIDNEIESLAHDLSTILPENGLADGSTFLKTSSELYMSCDSTIEAEEVKNKIKEILIGLNEERKSVAGDLDKSVFSINRDTSPFLVDEHEITNLIDRSWAIFFERKILQFNPPYPNFSNTLNNSLYGFHLRADDYELENGEIQLDLETISGKIKPFYKPSEINPNEALQIQIKDEKYFIKQVLNNKIPRTERDPAGETETHNRSLKNKTTEELLEEYIESSLGANDLLLCVLQTKFTSKKGAWSRCSEKTNLYMEEICERFDLNYKIQNETDFFAYEEEGRFNKFDIYDENGNIDAYELGRFLSFPEDAIEYYEKNISSRTKRIKETEAILVEHGKISIQDIMTKYAYSPYIPAPNETSIRKSIKLSKNTKEFLRRLAQNKYPSLNEIIYNREDHGVGVLALYPQKNKKIYETYFEE